MAIVTSFLSALFLFAAFGNKWPIGILVYLFTYAAVVLVFFLITGVPMFDKRELLDFWPSFFTITAAPLFFYFLFEVLKPGWLKRRFLLYFYTPLLIIFLAWVIAKLDYPSLPRIDNYALVKEYLYTPEIILRLIAMLALFIGNIVFIYLGYNLFGFCKKEEKPVDYVEWRKTLIRVKIAFYTIAMYDFLVLANSLQRMRWTIFPTATFFVLFPGVVGAVALRYQKKIFYKEENREKEESCEVCLTDNIPMQNGNAMNETLKNRLLLLLDTKEIYTDPDLTAKKVCVLLNTNRTYLTKVIHHELNTNFYSLINSFRLKKAIELLEDPAYKNYSINTIADEAGFKHVSTFSTQFKEKYGVTPRKWTKQVIDL